MMKKHMGCPGWLGLTLDRTGFVFIPERASIVRQIFEMSVAGLGGYTIAKKFNVAGIPGFGSSGKWDQSTIHNMLRSRATVGEFQKMRRIGGKETPVGDPVPNYYPAVIDEKLFQAAQQARANNLIHGRGRKGNRIANLFAGIAECLYCGKPVVFQRNGNSRSLICSTVLDSDNCHRFRWTYDDFERAFFDLAKGIRLQPMAQIIAKLQSADDAAGYGLRVETMLAVRAGVSKLIIATAGYAPPARAKPASVGRDHPDRLFEVTFQTRPPQVGRPLPAETINEALRLDPVRLIEALGISPRQADLVASLASGRSLNQAADCLGMGLSTAKWHLRLLFSRTQTHSQADLLKLARTLLVHNEKSE